MTGRKEIEINLKKIKNPTERDILLLIDQNDKCRYGEILKRLNLSYRKGQEVIYSLVSRGYIEFVGRSSDLQLTARIR